MSETMHGTQALDVPVENHDLEDYAGDQAYQMYQELLDIVRNADEEDDAESEPSTQANSRFAPNMSEVKEEMEPEQTDYESGKPWVDPSVVKKHQQEIYQRDNLSSSEEDESNYETAKGDKIDFT